MRIDLFPAVCCINKYAVDDIKHYIFQPLFFLEFNNIPHQVFIKCCLEKEKGAILLLFFRQEDVDSIHMNPIPIL